MTRHSAFVLCVLFVLALAAPASACLWYYGKNAKGETIIFDGLGGLPERFMRRLTDHEEHDSKLQIDTSQEPDPQGDFHVRSDYAATLIHQGKAAKAVPILEAIEKEHPEEYVIAVNLGTAYELSGDDEKALHWISEGIRRNANSHMGTEWLHVKILEAKIAAAKDPEWIKTHSVLGLDLGNGDVPVPPTRYPPGQSAESIVSALQYQLHERLAFVSPPDPLVGGMLGDLAGLAGLAGQRYPADVAVAVYDLALSYQPVQADLLRRRRALAATFTGHIVRVEERRNLMVMGIAIASIGGAVLLYIFWNFRKRSARPVA